ncbi:MAG: hypothetical protein JJE52_08530 [Acidimicrobiia bacterium]|nr:hypothetical protein [Acidimicrobiia bacterium]
MALDTRAPIGSTIYRSAMGILDKIKKAFDKGGVEIDIDCPEIFRWGDGVLPVAVRLENESDEERLVTSLELSLAEDLLLADHSDETPSERARRNRQNEKSAVTFNHESPITLAPGQVLTLEIEFPLSPQGALDSVGAGEEAPAWLSRRAASSTR